MTVVVAIGVIVGGCVLAGLALALVGGIPEGWEDADGFHVVEKS